MHFLIHKNTEWTDTGIKCHRCQHRILRETFEGNNLVTDNFACERMGCTWPSYSENKRQLMELDAGKVNLQQQQISDTNKHKIFQDCK